MINVKILVCTNQRVPSVATATNGSSAVTPGTVYQSRSDAMVPSTAAMEAMNLKNSVTVSHIKGSFTFNLIGLK